MLKSKEQALAMADALIAPANAKRRRQVDGRLQLLFGSSLSAIPEANWPEVQESARRYAARRWYVYVPCAIGVIWVLVAWLWPWLPGAGHDGVAITWAPVTTIAVTVMLQRRVIRSYVKREADKYRSTERRGEMSTNV